jgi:hypothetical protein
MHRKLALKFAAWLNADFELWVFDVIEKIMFGDNLRVRSNQEQLQMITNRGVKVWPQGFPETFCTDHWRCRFTATSVQGTIDQRDIVELMAALTDEGIDVIKTENLCTFHGAQGFALGQGQ